MKHIDVFQLVITRHLRQYGFTFFSKNRFTAATALGENSNYFHNSAVVWQQIQLQDQSFEVARDFFPAGRPGTNDRHLVEGMLVQGQQEERIAERPARIQAQGL